MLVIKSRPLRNLIRVSVPFVIVPAIAVVGGLTFTEKRHIIYSMAVAVFALLVFSAGFEKKVTGSRRLVIAAVMTALAFAGRAIPIIKPVTALTIISGIYLGSETGFLVGSMTAVLSNFYAGQGPWTAFQMLAWGVIGFMAGVFAEPLKSKRWLLLTFGALSGIAYSFIMDIWTVLSYSQGFSLKLYLTALVTAVPYTLSYAVSNVLFLWLLFKPFGEKLERIRIKYGV